ncbi:rhamnan synthesis F family protein [Roseovarius sp. M141]|uniref:rhamnan synthesis F family protein n=1 Tax=Roseovarius sp. M141 TaxID=2583806 RepID=UPI0020CF5F4B|nr:rhamnan synthesis F family protein [Roseovarius sp. M141]
MRYLFPSARERAYLRALRRSGAFDRAFYLKAHPGLHPLFRLMPQRHYVQWGEAKGLSPNARFAPRAYLHHNPDLDPVLTRPLLHYIETGRYQARTTLLDHGVQALPDLPVITPAPPAAKPAPVAVVLHLYYLDMWNEFAAPLHAQEFAFDLFVTLTRTEDSARTAAVQSRISAAFPQARIWILPNHGRDIFPFIHLLNAGLLDPYAAVCKLHSKKSPHRSDGNDWRRGLTAGVLGAPRLTRRRLDTFLRDPGAGFWVADGHRFAGDRHWGVNRPRAETLLARAGHTIPPGPLCFPAGSIYWVKQEVLQAIAGLHLSAENFEPEQALVDGTTAHALERLLGSLATLTGKSVREAQELDAQG